MANIINIAGAGRGFSYNQSYQKSQSEILSNPNQYGLYTADQYQAKLNEYNRGLTDGRNYVIDHPSSYDLFTASQYNNHDIPRKIGFAWKPHYSPTTDDRFRNEEWTLRIFVDYGLVKEGEKLYEYFYQPNANNQGDFYGYMGGHIDETFNV